MPREGGGWQLGAAMWQDLLGAVVSMVRRLLVHEGMVRVPRVAACKRESSDTAAAFSHHLALTAGRDRGQL